MEVQANWWEHCACRQLIELMEASGFAVMAAEGWTRSSHTLTLVGTRV